MCRRPDVAGAQILHIAPLAVVVARAVVPPARYGEIPETTETTARVRDESRVRNVAEDPDHRLRRVWRLDLAHSGLLHLAGHTRSGIALHILHREPAWNPLLQHQLGGPHQWIGVESTRPDLPVERVRERDDAHPDVVRHESAHHGFSRPGRWTCV